MSYSIDANLLIYASDGSSPYRERSAEFLNSCAEDPDLLCMTWPVLMAYMRIATHPSIFPNPVSPEDAWNNVVKLLNLPRCRIITEEGDFCADYRAATQGIVTRGNRLLLSAAGRCIRQEDDERGTGIRGD